MDSSNSPYHFLFGIDDQVEGIEKNLVEVVNLGSAEGPNYALKGWLMETAGRPINGVRAVCRGVTVVARRKQLRPAVMLKFKAHADALYSGFYIALDLRKGGNRITLEFKDDQGKWRKFATCEVRLPYFWSLRKKLSAKRPESDYEKWCTREISLSPPQAAEQTAWSVRQDHPLTISILVPTYNPPEKWLIRMIESVRAQTYPHWELCLADDCSTEPWVKKVLTGAAHKDARIKVTFREKNGHICHASNSALQLCTGEFIALVDHDDELTPNALYEMAASISAAPEVDLLFSDEDKIDEEGRLFDPYFKMGFNYDLFLHQNCFSHLGVFRTSLIRDIGGFLPGMEGSQDWDLTFRALAKVGIARVRHIPKVLYHWRTLETSTASSTSAKPYAVSAGMRAVSEHLRVVAPEAQIEPVGREQWKINWHLPSDLPLVSLIIPTKNRVDLLRVAVESLVKITAYPAYELIIVDHESDDPETLEYLREIEQTVPQARVVVEKGSFNWSKLNNTGARASKGQVLLFLNNDVELTDPGWLQEMVAQAWRPDVGAVGACLLFANGCIQHAGVVLSLAGIAGHLFKHARINAGSIGGHPNMPREVTAVTGACMAVRRDTFEKAGGFDEVSLPIAYNDIDFCLRLRSLGYKNIYTPFAQLIHHESLSRAKMEKESARKDAATEEARVVLSRWPDEFEQDAFFNPNLSKDSEWPMLR